MLLASGNGTEAARSEAGGVPAGRLPPGRPQANSPVGGQRSVGGLVYSSDAEPGFTRVRKGKGFGYRDDEGRWLRDPAQLARIRKLAIPPAYTSVWICGRERGHLQATGRDARGRKQYRYHETWRQERDTGKFDRLLAFSGALPRLRRQIRSQMAEDGHGRELVLATVAHLLDTTLIRIGNDQYAKENGSYGLTTLRARHVRIEGTRLRLAFRGKSGVQHEVEVKDPRVLKVVRRCLHLPGQELFQYRDEQGARHGVGSQDVNDYLHSMCGERFTAKDFRTWHGTVLALETLRKFCAKGEGFTQKQLLAEVSGNLGNTPAVCRKAYIHPTVLELGIALAAQKAEACFDDHVPPARPARGLCAAERRLVAFLSKKA